MRWIAECCVSSFLIVPMCQAQVITDYDTQAPALPSVQFSSQPDTTGIWFHIRQRQSALAEAEMARLQQVYPQWQPAPELREALAELSVNTVAPKAPPQVAPTQAVVVSDPTAQLFGKLSRLSDAQKRAVSKGTLAAAAKLASQANRADYFIQLGWLYHQQQYYAKALQQFEQAQRISADDKIRDGIQACIDGLVSHAAAHPDAEHLAGLVRRYPDYDITGAIKAIGWQAYNNQQYSLAYKRFAAADFVYGKVLALQQDGQPEQAQQLACDNDNISSLAIFCTDALALIQASEYAAEQYIASIQAAQRIAQRRALREGEQALLGWAYLAAGQPRSARTIFTQLLEDYPDDARYAQGLVSSLSSDQQRQQAARRHPGVALLVTRGFAGQAWQRKQFERARLLQNPAAVAVLNSPRLAMYTGINARSRSGEAGLGNFDVTHGYVGINGVTGPLQWQGQVDYEQLYSGIPDAGQWFGEGQRQNEFGGISGFEDTGVMANVMYEQQGHTLYGEIAYSLIDQPVAPRLTGQLGAAWFTDTATIAVTAYRERVGDSLLSQGSTWFENGVQAWGGVHKSGVRGLYSYLLTTQRALSLSGRIERYSGQRVIDNRHVSFRLDASQDVAANINAPLDYWRVGPYVSVEHFEHNASGFTRGHGGYFSPEILLSAGLYSELLTQEGRPWQLKAALNVGYNAIRQAGYYRFPLSQGGDWIAAQSSAGISADFKLEGQYLVAKHWAIAGFVAQSFAVEYRSTWAGIELRWHAGATTGLTSDTLVGNRPHSTGYAF